MFKKTTPYFSRVTRALFFLSLFLLSQLIGFHSGLNSVYGQQFRSKTDLAAYKEIHEKRIASISQYISEGISRLSPLVKFLTKKYPNKKISYVINQYPFENPNRKYWRQRQKAILEISSEHITKVEFIIENTQKYIGNQFQRTYIYDNSPRDSKFEDVRIRYKDYVMPQNDYEQKIGEITDLETKVVVMERILEIYKNLIKAVENDYYFYLRTLKINQKKMIGIGAY